MSVEADYTVVIWRPPFNTFVNITLKYTGRENRKRILSLIIKGHFPTLFDDRFDCLVMIIDILLFIPAPPRPPRQSQWYNHIIASV